MTQLKHISKNDFKGFTLQQPGFCIVECYNNSSGPLQIMEPVFSRLANESDIVVSHVRINIKDNPFIIEYFHILRAPAYLFFDNGVLTDKVEGLISFNQLYKTIQNHSKT